MVELRLVEVDDGEKLAVWDNGGTGEPVVLVHGFPENHLSWNGVLAKFSDEEIRRYRFITYDLRGHGESSKKGEASWQRFVQDHLCITKALGLGKYHLTGHDWGGAIGLHIARLFPEDLLSLSVMNTNFWKTDLKGMWHLTFLNLPVIAPLSFQLFPEKIYELFLKKSFLDPSNVDDDIRQTYLAAFRDRATTDYWIRLYQSMAKSLLGQVAPVPLKKYIARTKTSLPRSSERAFHVPTRLIWGREDTFNPLHIGRDIESRLKKMGTPVEFMEVAGAGHFVAEEQPQVVAKLLLDHWRQE